MNTRQEEFFPGVIGLRWEPDSQGAHVLVTKEGDTTVIGAVYKSFRGDLYVLRGGRPPHHTGSTGRVWVEKLGGEKLDSGLEVIA